MLLKNTIANNNNEELHDVLVLLEWTYLSHVEPIRKSAI